MPSPCSARSLTAAALILATPLAARGQPPPPAVSEAIQVTEVLLDVLVTDRDGNVIIGLGDRDFVVEEEGEPVDITGVRFYSNRRNLDARDRDEAAQPIDDRYLILFFHDRTRDDPTQRSRLTRAGRDAESWIRSGLTPGDRIAVVGYDFKLKVYQDFTSDQEALVLAVRSAIVGKEPALSWPSRMPPESDAILLAALPRGKELRDRTRTFFDGMRVLGEATRSMRARKTLLLFSHGFEGDGRGRGVYQPDRRYYRPMMEALNDSNVAVYSLDLAPPGVQHSLRDSLNQLSHETGGTYYPNVTSFDRVLESVADENSGYYLLSYRSQSPSGDSGYREVDIRTVNKEFRVRGRQGFRYGRK